MTPHDGCRVSPFGHPRIKACSAAPRGFSQLTTSFIGSRRLGIHRWLFVAWKNKDARARYAILKGLDTELEERALVERQVAGSRPAALVPDAHDKAPAAGEPVIGALGALPGNRRQNERPTRRTPGRSEDLQPLVRSNRSSNQCINWVVAHWPGLVTEQSARRTP